jgi:hypothetical protein
MRKETKNMSKNDKVDVIVSEVVDFIAYVESFYGNVPNAIYPIGASPKMIIAATSKYINSLNDKVTWGGGDSLDRERVRDILIEDNNLVWKH